MRKLLLISCVMALSSPAFAQTIDAKGADQLANTLSKYVGKTAIKKGILKVTPEGDAYRIVFNTDAFLKALPKQDAFKLSLTDYSILSKPLADGTWDVSSTAFPAVSVEFTGPTGPQVMDWASEGFKLNGLYDPKINTFSKSTFSFDSAKIKIRNPAQDADASTGPSKGEMLGSLTTSGGVDFTTNQSTTDFKETVITRTSKLPGASGMSGEAAKPDSAVSDEVKITLGAGELGSKAEGKNLKNNEMMDLWAFFVAHADQKKLKKPEDAELKQKLSAVLPLWDNIAFSYYVKALAINTSMGSFGAENISQDVKFDGISKSGAYHYTLRTNGLKYPTLPIPEWGVPFLPTDVELTVGTKDLDLDTVVKGAIEDMDLNRAKVISEEFEAKTAAQFLIAPPKLVISKSLVRTPDAELTVEGEVTFAALKPESHTTWEMSGFDKVVERLNKAGETDETIKQYIVFVKLAKDFGTQIDGGKIQWVVDQKADGSVAINGNPVKGPDPVAVPGADDAIDSDAPEGEEDNTDTDTAK
ncbi:hypothetical protein [Phyllobacterium sp. OV277]|uniref:hypothetical protein n=1 Tax=Phyllobacterium sp. OV277 TaxID=1882772 RepID=UPI00088AFEC3|nr:hypothetical protein [Phyllobacterium sp. OV277]SDP76388.1 hypothetical protein SAMN05443582_109141 [Phyllobacterium sp. OV277]